MPVTKVYKGDSYSCEQAFEKHHNGIATGIVPKAGNSLRKLNQAPGMVSLQPKSMSTAGPLSGSAAKSVEGYAIQTRQSHPFVNSVAKINNLQAVYPDNPRNIMPNQNVNKAVNEARGVRGPTKKLHAVKPVDLSIPKINTIFVNNLCESVKGPTMKKALEAAFKQFGEIIDIVAMRSLSRRGQAYVSFKEADEADAAMKAMQGFPLFSKPLRIEFAKCNSDKVAKILNEYQPRPPRPPRMTKKERKQMAIAKKLEEQRMMKEAIENNPLTAPLKPVFQFGGADGIPPPPPEEGTGINLPTGKGGSGGGFMPPPPPVSAPEQPPNKILFLERLPENSSELMISVLFNQFAGYRETRLVPGRSDLAFVEFEKLEQAAIAKKQLNNFKITPTHAMKVTFAKK